MCVLPSGLFQVGQDSLKFSFYKRVLLQHCLKLSFIIRAILQVAKFLNQKLSLEIAAHYSELNELTLVIVVKKAIVIHENVFMWLVSSQGLILYLEFPENTNEMRSGVLIWGTKSQTFSKPRESLSLRDWAFWVQNNCTTRTCAVDKKCCTSRIWFDKGRAGVELNVEGMRQFLRNGKSRKLPLISKNYYS